MEENTNQQDQNNMTDQSNTEESMQTENTGQAGDADQQTEMSEVEMLKQQVEELKNAYARSAADFENFKKRSETERSRFVQMANMEFCNALIPCFESIEKTLSFVPEDQHGADWYKGFDQTVKLMNESLQKLGLEKMETVGENLDPNKHEAMMKGPGEEGVIIEEFSAGYTLHGDVIRFPKVKVGNGEQA